MLPSRHITLDLRTSLHKVCVILPHQVSNRLKDTILRLYRRKLKDKPLTSAQFPEREDVILKVKYGESHDVIHAG